CIDFFRPSNYFLYIIFSVTYSRKNKLHGGVMFMPILPGIGDTEDNIKEIVRRSKEVNAEFILAGVLTLKPGRNKIEYLKVINIHYKHLLALYGEIYGNNDKFGIPDTKSDQIVNIYSLVHEYCHKNGIPDRMPRYIPPGVHYTNYLVSTVLQNLEFYYKWVKDYPSKLFSSYRRVATEIESYHKNIRELKGNELKTLFKISNELLDIITEIIEIGKSSHLSEFLDYDKVTVKTI
ncbi:MAG: hypothetical protein ACFFE4_18445, partial [Candidatus Thorarchaeota archaeon]